MNPLDITPKKDYALVLMEPRKQLLSSGILLPAEETGIEKVTEGCGHIMRLGSGNLIKSQNLAEGDRVCFRAYLKYAIPLNADECWEDGRKKEYFFIAVKDLIAVIPETMDVGCFSVKKEKS